MYNPFSPRRSRIFEIEVGLAYHLFSKEVQYIMFFPKGDQVHPLFPMMSNI